MKNLQKIIMDKAAGMFTGTAKSSKHIAWGLTSIDFMEDGSVFYEYDGKKVHAFHSLARDISGREITTASAKRESIRTEYISDSLRVTALYSSGDMRLTQQLILEKDSPWVIVSLTLSKRKGSVESNYLAPMDFIYPNSLCNPLFLSLDQKMLLVPYDNDMWVRYESAPLRPGRASYDITAVYDENSLNGLVIGALDFDTWKNAVKCSAFDARKYTAFSGAADECTHDRVPHGSITGKEVSASRFVLGWFEDIREGLEKYGSLAMQDKTPLRWSHGVPFGWNSYSALAIGLTPEHLEKTADFFKNELTEFHSADGSTFINMDAAFGLSEKKLKEIRDNCRASNQHVGTYASPALTISMLDFLPMKGSPLKKRSDTVMKFPDGTPYGKIDSGVPIDITLPEVEKEIRLTLQDVVKKGYDYLKIDFLSHAAVEGTRHDPAVRTGRQALTRLYNIIDEELDPKKAGRDIFISLSIAPLFPAGFGHARRCCCDAFGHHEDVRYILNALNFAWWTSGTLYSFADPDHTVLYKSVVDGREATREAEARSRYNASVISGTVMLLSDNFGPGEEMQVWQARERAKKLANNPELNAVARIGKPFRPVSLKDGTCNVYYLIHNGEKYLALFNFDNAEREAGIAPGEVSMPNSGTAENLNTGAVFSYSGRISVTLRPYDSALLRIT